MLTVGSLFAGIGGFDLGLERAGMRTVWFCEQDPFCRRVLARHWPGVPCYPDVRELRAGDVERPVVLAGGFPCTDVSQLGGRAGLDGEQSGLWTEYARLVGELRPQYVIVENVPSLTVRGLGRVLGDLADLGYDAEWDCLPAAHVGAPHLRLRLWLVAYPAGVGDGLEARVFRPGRAQLEHSDWWACEPRLVRVADGIPARVDRLRALGNSLVPQIAEWIGMQIINWEKQNYKKGQTA